MTVGETMAVVVPARAHPLVSATSFTLASAGAESNVAQYLAHQGHDVGWASRLGDDPLGQRIMNELTAQGIDLSYVTIDPTAPTGTMFKDPRGDSTRVLYYRRNSAASCMGPDLVDALPWSDLQVLHLSGITPALSDSCMDLVHALFDRAASEGIAVSFDVNFRSALWDAETAAPVLLELANRADHTLIGLDEAQSLWRGVETATDIRQLLPHPRRLIVKDGSVGATEFDGQVPTFVPAPPVVVVECVGAGDAFAAGYLSGVLDGLVAGERLARGHSFAARALTSTHDFQEINSAP